MKQFIIPENNTMIESGIYTAEEIAKAMHLLVDTLKGRTAEEQLNRQTKEWSC